MSRRQGRVDYSARARIHEAALPGPADVRAHLLHDALDLAERAAMPAVEAEALATWVRLDPTRADLRARAERLLAQPGTVPSPIRELVRLLLGETLDPAEVARRAMWRIATRLVPFA